MYKLFVALRYLRANKIIYFSIAGVAIGIMVMIIVTSVMGGFVRDYQARVRGLQAHLELKSPYATTYIEDYEQVVRELKEIPHVKGVAPRIEWAVSLGYRGTPRTIMLVGIDPASETTTSDLAKFFARGGKGSFDFRDEDGSEPIPPGIVVGSEMGGFRGGRVFLETLRQGDNWMHLRNDFTILGHFRSGMAEYDSGYAFVSLEAMQRFMKLGPPFQKPVVNAITISVDDYDRYGLATRQKVLDVVHRHWPCRVKSDHAIGSCGPYRVQTWQEAKSILLQAVAIEKGIQSIILFCIVIVAGFNIIAIYTMMVRAKTRDVGILRSLGATRGGVTSIFLLSGGLCGLFGSALGIIAGTLVATNLNEIVAFVRVTSRGLNDLAWSGGGQTANRMTTALSYLLFLFGFGTLIWSWLRLYKPFRAWDWLRSGLTAILTAVGCLAFFSWTGKYRPLLDDDPQLGGNLGWWIAGIMGSIPLLWSIVRMASDRYRETFFGGFLRIVGTVAYSALAVLLFFGGLGITSALLTNSPPRNFTGWDLFPRQVYYIDKVPVLIDPATVIGIVLATLMVSLVFSIYPAIRAASYNPVEAIRDE